MSFENCRLVSINTDASAYHESKNAVERGSKSFAMSPSSIREFGKSARRWFRGYQPPESDAKDFGSLLDMRLLTPELFGEHYAIHPATYKDDAMECPSCKSITDSKKCRKCGVDRVPVTVEKEWNGNASACSKWVVDQKGKRITSVGDVSECDTAIKRLLEDDIVSSFLACSDKQVLLRGKWHDEKTGLTVPVECLIDLWPRKDTEFGGSLADLKCVRSGALVPFQRQVFQFGWHVQAAFDLDMAIAASGEDRNTFCIVGVENYPPFEPIRRMFSQVEGSDIMGIGRMTYQHALKRYCACLKSGKWPGYDDHADAVQGWSLINAEPWMEFEFVSKVMESDQVDALEENVDVPMP